MESKLYLPGEVAAEPWLNAIRHKVMLNGHIAWIVEPPMPQKKKYWFFVPEWPDAFPNRNGVEKLLQMGFHMIYVNVFGKFANDEALEIMHSLYDYVTGLGFEKKGALIGMSLGGLYSFRFAQKYPECVSCIYADAPACDLHYRFDAGRADAAEISRAYGFGDDGEKLRPFSPVNNVQPLVDAKIPLLLILGLSDNTVDVKKNGLLLADRWEKAGGDVTVISRPHWGHHPHGLDDPMPIVRFIAEHTLR